MTQNGQIGNEENLAQVRALMETSQQVQLGNQLNVGVPIDFKSPYEGKHYTGTIVFKRPSMMDYMKIGTLKAQYLNENGFVNINMVDQTIKYMSQAMATLKVLTVKAPAWLLNGQGLIDIETIQDPELVFYLFDLYEEWENTFRSPVQDAKGGDSEATE